MHEFIFKKTKEFLSEVYDLAGFRTVDRLSERLSPEEIKDLKIIIRLCNIIAKEYYHQLGDDNNAK